MGRRTRRKQDRALQQAYKDVWNSEQGRRVFADLMVRSGVFNRDNTSSSIDMAFAAGERNLALHIVGMIGWKPEQAVEASEETFNIIEDILDTGHAFR